MNETKTLVMKFGGTSVGTAQAMGRVVEITRAARNEWPRVVIVVSAVSGVTNLLLQSAQHAVQGDSDFCMKAVEQLTQAHKAISGEVVPDAERRAQVEADVERLVAQFSSLCQAIQVLGEATPRALDAIATLGERMCVRLAAAALDSAGIASRPMEASELIVTDHHFQDAHPDLAATSAKTRQALEPLLAAGIIPVVTGFMGATPEGTVTTLGRGGSDYSASILGAVLPADDVWIWTDVDGVMSADPRIAPDARTIPELTYREIAELAYYGARVLHPKTIRPVIESGIGLRICNSFNPSHPGTRLVAGRPHNAHVIQAVTSIRNQQLVTIEGRGMLGVPGVAARTFAAVASTRTSVPLITQASSEQSICFAVPATAAAGVVAALEKDFARELADHDIDRVWASPEVVIITVVGIGMIHTPGIAGKVFTTLGNNRINVIAIAQGSSEVSISLVVDADQADPAVRVLHDLIVSSAAGQGEEGVSHA
jgi:bifunctional aspartokinase / homoserine dehydrogenase 1